jgi:hypothetical protein
MFAEIARLEAASIRAFADLARALRLHDAPTELIVRVDRARRDEIRHARATATIAKRYGARVVRPSVKRLATRTSLFELACDNASEGCIRETYGALVAHYQAGTALDPLVAHTMKMIAIDETEHAVLSWDLAAWFDTVLREHERIQVDAQRALAGQALAAELTVPVSDDAVSLAGMPTTTVAQAMLAELALALAASSPSRCVERWCGSDPSASPWLLHRPSNSRTAKVLGLTRKCRGLLANGRPCRLKLRKGFACVVAMSFGFAPQIVESIARRVMVTLETAKAYEGWNRAAAWPRLGKAAAQHRFTRCSLTFASAYRIDGAHKV